MVKFKLLLCAQGIIRDAETDAISVYSIFEGIDVHGLPLLIQRFFVFAMLEREPHDPPQHQGTVRLTVGETEVFANPVRVDFQDKLLARQIIRLDGLIIESPGELVANISIKDGPSQDYRIPVRKVGQPEAAMSQA